MKKRAHNFINHSGEKHNEWEIIMYIRTDFLDRNRAIYLCQCSCGFSCEQEIKQIISGRSKSCGHPKVTPDTNAPDSQTLLYKTWLNMKNRCCNKNNPKFKNYGARGIKVCDRWLNSFSDFRLDMGDKPNHRYSLDRINNDGDYEPSNCRWATTMQQAHNKQTSPPPTH